MLRLLALILCFFVTNYMFSSNIYSAECDQQDESTTIEQSDEEEDDGIVLLSYNSDSKQGRVIQTSAECSDNKNKDTVEDKDCQEECKEISCDKIMEKDFANMRIIQLASIIADDMGIITKVSLNR